VTAREAGEWLLVVRLRQLGDVLASLEVLRAIREFRPERKIALVVDAPYVELVEHETYIDRVMPPPARGAVAWVQYLAQIRGLQAGAAIDLHGSVRSALITRASGARVRAGFDVRLRRRAYTVVEARGEWQDGRRIPHDPITWGMRLARHVGAKQAGPVPPALRAGAASRSLAFERMCGAGVSPAAMASRRLVGLNPGRPVATKSWSSSHFVALARRLREQGCEAVVFWGPKEEAVARRIADEAGVVMAPPLSLVEMLAALPVCAALVTIDSGLKHLAVCARVPTVTVFGSTDPHEWHMGDADDVVLWKGLSCSPCRRSSCPFGTPCMDVGVDTVLGALERVMGGGA